MSITRDEGQQRVHVQSATAAESAVVIQVGGDLYLSDAGLSSLWTPGSAVPGDCPYPGLDAFGPGQAQWFFGRENGTGELLRHLDEMTRGGPRGSGGPLLVVGPSGAGKSSLLGAGLLAAIAAGRLPAPGSADWPRVMITPGPHPLQTLRTALVTLSRAPSHAGSRIVLVVDQLEEIFTVCDDEAERAAFLAELAAASGAGPAGDGAGPAGSVPLPADAIRPATVQSATPQSATPQSATAFPPAVPVPAHPGGVPRALVVLGIRADFYAQATAYPVLRAAMQSRQVVLGAMSAADVRLAISGPARTAGLTLEAGLTDRLLADLGVEDTAGLGGGYEPGRLPLLAHALRATWQHRDGSRLTIAGYEATGGIGGAIARTAEEVYGRLDEAGQAAARRIFLSLVRVGDTAAEGDEGTADTRRRVAAASLLEGVPDPAAARATLEAFTTARLVTYGGTAAQITHEALLRRWPRLRAWLDDDRAGHLIRQDLEDAAAAWERQGRDASGLYGGVRLAAARAWAETTGRAGELTALAQDFLAASNRLRQRGVRRRNAFIAALAALSLVLAALSVFAFAERSTADSERATAESNYLRAEGSVLAAESQQAGSDVRPDTALEFATAAERADKSSAQVRSALLTTQSVPITGRLSFALPNGDAPDVTKAAFNPAGTVIAGVTSTGGIKLFSASTHRQLWSYSMSGSPTSGYQSNGVAFSPDGRTLAAAYPGEVLLWDVANPAHPVPLKTLGKFSTAPFFQTLAIAFSPDGTMLAQAIYEDAASAGKIVLWNLSSHATEGVIPAASSTFSMAFTPDGRTLVTGSGFGGIGLWDVASRTRTAVLQQPGASAQSGSPPGVAVSPDGQTIAFITGNSTSTNAIKLWSLASHTVVGTVHLNTVDNAISVAFSPDGKQLATGGTDGIVRLWDIRTMSDPVLMTTYYGHRYEIQHIAFSPSGATIASASNDGSIALWSAQGTTLDGVANISAQPAFSPDGKTLAIATTTGSKAVIALYSMPSRRLLAQLPTGHFGYAFAFSPDGKTLAMGFIDEATSPSGVVELWNVAAHRLIGDIVTHQAGDIRSLTFSPDGTLLATSGYNDPMVRVWSVTRLTQVAAINAVQHSTYPNGYGGTFMVAFSPDGKLLAVLGIDGFVRLFSVPGFALASYFLPLDIGDNMAFSPDGHYLATGGGNGNVYLFSVPMALSAIHKVPSGQKAQNSVAYSANVAVFEANSKTITAVGFQSDSTLIAVGYDGDIRLWAMPRPSKTTTFVSSTIPAATLATHAGQIIAMSYSTQTGILATATLDVGTRVWQLNPAQVATSICQALRTPVVRSLWKEYVPEFPYEPVCGG